jgi:hypothetical protein
MPDSWFICFYFNVSVLLLYLLCMYRVSKDTAIIRELYRRNIKGYNRERRKYEERTNKCKRIYGLVIHAVLLFTGSLAGRLFT